MKKTLLAASLMAFSMTAHSDDLYRRLMASCERPGRPAEDLAHCQQVLTSLYLQAGSLPMAPVYTPPRETKCEARQNVFGNWTARCY